MPGILHQGLRAVAILAALSLLAACGSAGDAGNGDGGGGDGDGDGSNAAPTVAIAAPSDGAEFASGATVTFSGSASDPEDGDLAASLVWTSDLDGQLGTGGSVSSGLSDGDHTVTASVEDSDGSPGSAQVAVTVGDAGGDGGDGDDGGGAGGGEGGTGDLGFLAVSEVESEADASVAVSGGGGFWRSDPAIEGAFFADPWGEIVDTCEVLDTGDVPEDPFGDIPVPDTLDITFIDAGTPVTIASTGDAAYLELDRETFELGGQTTIGYSSVGEGEEPQAGPLADGLSASIPGADFPAVAAAAFPAADAFALIAPADPGATGSVSSTTEFTWTAGTGDGNAIVTIEVATPLDPETFTVTTVTCYAEDDGSFSFPADVQAELGAGFSGSVESAARQSVRAQEVGEDWLLLLVERSIEYDVALFPIPIPTP